MATGIAAIPLLFAKLWTVYPRLFQTPVVRDVAHALERLSLVPLVGGALFMLVTGVANIDLWYPWPFFFPAGHYWMAWVTDRRPRSSTSAPRSLSPGTALRRSGRRARRPSAPTSRRTRATPTAAGSSPSWRPPRACSPGHRRPDRRPAAPPRPARAPPSRPRHPGLPREQVGGRGRRHRRRHRSRRTAWSSSAAAPSWPASPSPTFAPCPSAQATLPISCVEGWSASRRWSGRGRPRPARRGRRARAHGRWRSSRSRRPASTASPW